MRYFYTPTRRLATAAKTYKCNHPLYDQCTLYLIGDRGLAVVQKRFNAKLKTCWFGPIDYWLVDDIFEQERFRTYFDEHASEEVNGIFPTVTVRQIMWALRMKPLPKEEWEDILNL